MRRVADASPGRVVDPDGDELLQVGPAGIDHAQSGVPGTHEPRGALDHVTQEHVE